MKKLHKMFCARIFFFINSKVKVALIHKLQKTLLLVSNGQKLEKLFNFFVRGESIRDTQFIIQRILQGKHYRNQKFPKIPENIFVELEKIFFVGVEKKIGHSFDVKNSNLSIYEVFRVF